MWYILDRRRAAAGLAPALLLTAALLTGCATGSKDASPLLMDSETRALLSAGTQALQQHAFSAALALADSAEKRSPEEPGVPFLRARVFSEMIRFKEAEEAYRRVLKLDPEYRGVWHNMGNNAFREQAYRVAISHYRKELERYPAPSPWRGIGRAYQELGVVDSARQAFLRAIDEDSSYVQPYIDLAQLLDHEGDFDEGLQYARQAQRLDPDNQDGHYLLGLLLVKTGQFEEAISHLYGVVEKWPWHHSAHYNLGQALVRLGRQAEGQQYLTRSEELRRMNARIDNMQTTVSALPDDPYAHAGLGAALRMAGRYNDAMHAYSVALDIDPENLEFRNNVAVLHLLRGENSAAIEMFRSIVSRDSTVVDAWLNLGIVYAKSDMPARARQAWQTVLRLDPNNESAGRYLARLERES